jgi:hypothetical protein
MFTYSPKSRGNSTVVLNRLAFIRVYPCSSVAKLLPGFSSGTLMHYYREQVLFQNAAKRKKKIKSEKTGSWKGAISRKP